MANSGVKLMAAAWEDFRRTVLVPSGASDVQTREMQKAFYAGAQAFLSQLCGMFEKSGSDEPTPADLAIILGINQELEEFAVSVIASSGVKRA
jgi:hypothetical protein